MIKVIITDLGGVFFKKGTNLFLKKLGKKIKARKEVLNDLFKSSGLNGKLYRKGKISREEFWNNVISKTGISRELIPHLEKMWFSSYTLNKGMKNLMIKLRTKYKLIVFSGNIKERIRYLDKKYNLRTLFDDFVYSFDAGYNKNEFEFYKFLKKRVKVKPSECVVIDDIKEVLFFAEKLGFKTIQFKDYKRLKIDLKSLGVKV